MIKDNAIENMKQDLDIMKAQVADLENALALLPDMGDNWGILNTICFQVHIPYNLETAKEITAKLEAVGWVEFSRCNRELAGDAAIYFKHPDTSLVFSLILNPSQPGATCKRNIIDYRKEPIYEIVCNEA